LKALAYWTTKEIQNMPETVEESRPKLARDTRRKLFAIHFIQLPDAKAAAIKCGANPKTAANIGWRLLRHPTVQKIIAEHTNKAMTQAVLTFTRKREILREIAANVNEKAMARIAAISLDADLAGERPHGRAKSLHITAALKPGGQPVVTDPIANLLPRLDAWRKLKVLQQDNLDKGAPGFVKVVEIGESAVPLG